MNTLGEANTQRILISDIESVGDQLGRLSGIIEQLFERLAIVLVEKNPQPTCSEKPVEPSSHVRQMLYSLRERAMQENCRIEELLSRLDI